MLVELDRHRAPGPQRLEDAVAQLEAAVGRRGAAGSAAEAIRPLIQTAAPAASRATSTAPIARSGPRALATVSSHSSAGSLRHVIPPPTWSVSRRPSATNVRIRMLVPSRRRARSSQASPCTGRGRRAPGSASSSMARIFGAPVIDPPGNAAASRSNGSMPGGERASTVRHQVLDRAGPLEAAQPWHANGPGRRHAAEIVAEHVHDHHVLGAVLGTAEELAREAAILGAVAAAGTRALDRVRRDDAAGVDRQERLRRGRQDRARPAGRRSAQVEERRERRRVAGPQRAGRGPTDRAANGVSSRRVRLAWYSSPRAMRVPDRARRRPRRSRDPGSTEGERPAAPAGRRRSTTAAGRGHSAGARRDVVEAPGEPRARRRRAPGRPATPHRSGVPGDRPVVEPEPQEPAGPGRRGDGTRGSRRAPSS